MLKLSWISAVAMAAGLTLAVPVQAGPYKDEYKLSVVAGKPLSYGVVAEDWADKVRQRTDGRINIRVYPNSVLIGGDQTREFSALRQGIIDLAIGPGISWSPQVKEFNVFFLPFLIPTDQVADAMVASPVGDRIFARLRQLGVEPLAWGDSGFRIVSNSKREIRKPEDLVGLKIRSIGSPLFTDFYSTLGANPTQMTQTDMQPALATGAVDGTDQSVEGFKLLKLATLRQKHLTLLNYCWEPAVFSVNKDVWNSWSPADREVVRAAAVEEGLYMRELKRKGYGDGDTSQIDEMKAAGTDVIALSPEAIAAFRQATKSVYDKWAKQLDPELVAAAEKVSRSVAP
jgi:tripartite ATP-independent transporter DctP family solute receptor